MSDGGAGGYGHIVFDDCNTEDGHIDWCIKQAEEKRGILSEETRIASIEALKAFKPLTEEERDEVYEAHWA